VNKRVPSPIKHIECMKKHSDMNNVSVLILAGQRAGVIDPLCAEAGIERKAVLPINGRPMIDYVLDALSQAGLKRPFHISGYSADHDGRLVQSPHAPGPAGSTLAALTQKMENGEHISFPLIVTTADHPLLKAEMLESFVNGARRTGADFCVGLASREVVQPAYPEIKRTYLKFSDIDVSGCNLFYVANEKGIEAVRFWQKAQHYRKRPVKLASQFGFRILFDYLRGRLSLDGAFEYASNHLKIKAKPVLISIAEAAIDVDKPSDKKWVETILIRQGQAST